MSWVMTRNFRGISGLKPAATFRVYCDILKHGKFYEVLILRRKDQLVRAAELVAGDGRVGHGALGFCHSLDVLRKTRRGWHPTKLAGYVVLVQGALSSGYVSHEMTHAAYFRLLRSGGKKRPWESVVFNDPSVSEPLAWLQGWLVAQFWVEFYQRFPQATDRRPRRLNDT